MQETRSIAPEALLRQIQREKGIVAAARAHHRDDSRPAHAKRKARRKAAKIARRNNRGR